MSHPQDSISEGSDTKLLRTCFGVLPRRAKRNVSSPHSVNVEFTMSWQPVGQMPALPAPPVQPKQPVLCICTSAMWQRRWWFVQRPLRAPGASLMTHDPASIVAIAASPPAMPLLPATTTLLP